MKLNDQELEALCCLEYWSPFLNWALSCNLENANAHLTCRQTPLEVLDLLTEDREIKLPERICPAS